MTDNQKKNLLKLSIKPFTLLLGDTYVDPKTDPETGYFYILKKRIFYRAFIVDKLYDDPRISRETIAILKAAKDPDKHIVVLLLPLGQNKRKGEIQMNARIYDCSKILQIPGIDNPFLPPAVYDQDFWINTKGELISDKHFWDPEGNKPIELF